MIPLFIKPQRQVRVVCATCGFYFAAPRSLTLLLQVIIAAFWAGACPLFVPLSLSEWRTAPAHTKHRLSSQEVPCCHQARHNKHSPPPPASLRCAQLSGECRCLEASCIKLPHSGQRRGGAVGARLFWHSLYVLLIGANWHRGAPLFRCIIWPRTLTWKERE